MNSKNLLESVFDEYDVALDYVEHEVGANDFKHNWPKLKSKINVVQAVQDWLVATKTPEISAQKIVEIIDEMAKQGTTWLTPFNRRLPTEA